MSLNATLIVRIYLSIYLCMYVCIIAEKNGSDSYSVVPLFQWQLDLLAGKVTSNENNPHTIFNNIYFYIHYTCIYTYIHIYKIGVAHDVADLQNFAAVKNKW